MAAEFTRTMITDELWKELESALKAAKHSRAGAPPAQGDRDFLEAVLWMARTGSPWRDLPAELGYWHAVYMRFQRWEARGIWKRLWQTLQTDHYVGARHLFIDSTSVKVHQHAAGAPKKRAPNRLWDALAGEQLPRFTQDAPARIKALS